MLVVGAMKMGNIVPRVGSKPTSLAFRASVLSIHHIGSLMSPIFPHLPVYVGPCRRGQCRILHSWCMYLIVCLLLFYVLATSKMISGRDMYLMLDVCGDACVCGVYVCDSVSMCSVCLSVGGVCVSGVCVAEYVCNIGGDVCVH